MRSMVGVGITPPNVLGTPKPASSVMISNTLGAPFGGTIRGAHQGLDCRASSLITPPNFGSGAGSRLPLMLVVAPGEPGVPVICWAATDVEIRNRSEKTDRTDFLQCMAHPHRLTAAKIGKCSIRTRSNIVDL